MNPNQIDIPTVVDLFCGAGGMSLGFIDAGFKIIRAIDNWSAAVQTYSANLADHVIEQSVCNDLDLPNATVYIGGPPCQGFSSAGRRRAEDERNSLVTIFANLIAKAKPNAFVFENVEGFLTGAKGRFVFELLEPLIAAGYRIHLRKINAAHYGVPQHRKRVLAIGGLGWDPTFPEPTHAAFGAPGAELANLHVSVSTPTLAEALACLPPAKEQQSNDAENDHVYARLEGDDLKRAELLAPGQRMRDLPEELWHESYRRRANRRVMDGTPSEKRGGAPSGVRRLNPNEPSKAITGGSLRDFLHPTENRYLTVRECATLQTFPADFTFIGRPVDRIQLIGNAVPPVLAKAIAKRLRLDLANRKHINSEGRLLSFVPTLSSGMSPILSDVVTRVQRQFMHTAIPREQRLLWH
jgi:DNA (cytosine-5)-methyltransferase 1